MKPTYYLGRMLQVFALLLLPSAIWVAEFRRGEAEAILIFLAAVGIFFIGWLLHRFTE